MSRPAHPTEIRAEGNDDAMRQTLYGFCCRNNKDLLLLQWDTEKNAPDTPQTVSYDSQRKMWWRCEKGHSWQTAVYVRTSGAGCPYCTGRKVGYGNDLASLYPELAAQWDLRKNAPRKPSDVSAGSQRLAWWVCEKGHSWRAQIKSRVSGCGCPVCSDRLVVAGENSLADVAPKLVCQWDAEKNGALSPEAVTPASNRKAWWKCPLGHSYSAVISSRALRGSDCPYCAGSKALAGFNDLAAKAPDVAAQWHPTLNGNLTPEMVTPGSHRRVWWQCSLGHTWKAFVYSRTGAQKCGCPVCAGMTRAAKR